MHVCLYRFEKILKRVEFQFGETMGQKRARDEKAAEEYEKSPQRRSKYQTIHDSI